MDITITPGKLSGTIQAIPSKSQAHRLLICAAFADRETMLHCPETNQDIEATTHCLRMLGADIQRTAEGYQILPAHHIPETATLDCRESGSTLRFMLPIAGALGVDTLFQMSGRLPERPLSPLWEEMERMGCRLSKPTRDTIRCTGKLVAGVYNIDGGVSSQFITGLLFATSLLSADSQIQIQGTLESAPYVQMTQNAMALFGVDTAHFTVRGGQQYLSPGELTVEGDWSNGAFFLAAKALGSALEITNLSPESAQGDKTAAHLLKNLHLMQEISAADIPDLVPILAVAAGASQGAVFTDIRRLRLKESDRVESVIRMITALGGTAKAEDNRLIVSPGTYSGGTVDAQNDHRIAMAAAIAATVCTCPVTILGAECVKKSYPRFWEEYRRLGGNYEQHLR